MALLHQPPKSIVIGLLNAAHLPTADLTDQHLRNFWGFSINAKIVAIVGLEPFIKTGLLRSLVVSPRYRGRGIGTHLVSYAADAARQMQLQELYLLTSTAQEFFDDLGFHVIQRSAVPTEIRATREFSELCPLHSIVMKLDLTRGAQPKLRASPAFGVNE